MSDLTKAVTHRCPACGCEFGDPPTKPEHNTDAHQTTMSHYGLKWEEDILNHRTEVDPDAPEYNYVTWIAMDDDGHYRFHTGLKVPEDAVDFFSVMHGLNEGEGEDDGE